MKRVIALTLSLLVFVSVACGTVSASLEITLSGYKFIINQNYTAVQSGGESVNVSVYIAKNSDSTKCCFAVYVDYGSSSSGRNCWYSVGSYFNYSDAKYYTVSDVNFSVSNGFVFVNFTGKYGSDVVGRFYQSIPVNYSPNVDIPYRVISDNVYSSGHLFLNVFLTLFGIPVSDTFTTAFDDWLNSHYGYDIDYLLFNKLVSAELVELPTFVGGGGETRGGGVGRRWDCTKEDFVESVSMMSTVVGSSFDSNSDIIQEAIHVMEQDIAAGKEDSFVWNIPVDSSGNVVQGLPPLMYLPERVGVVVNSPDYVPVTSGNYDHTYNGTMATNPNWPNTIAFPPSTSSDTTSSEPTSSGGDYVVSSDAVTSSMVDSGHVDIGTIEGFESDIFGGISDSGVDPGDFSFSSGFVRALDFIAKTWTRCFNGLGDFKAVITFPLYLGVALFILGRLALLMPSDRRRSSGNKKPKDKGGG